MATTRCTTEIPDLSLVKLKVVATDMPISIILWSASCTLVSQRRLRRQGSDISLATGSDPCLLLHRLFLLITQLEDNLSFLHLRV